MPRRLRVSTGGVVFHVLNRVAGRRRLLFAKDGDFLSFLKILDQAHQRHPTVRILSYVLMPNHWHLVLWPTHDGQLSQFLRWLSVTHAQRHHAHHHTAGTGPLYQGRFKSFPVQDDRHLLIVCRYVERNPLRAKLVREAEQWRWSSLHDRTAGKRPDWLLAASRWPVAMPRDWLAWVNQPQTPAEQEAMRESIRRGRPFGDDAWQRATARTLALDSTLRPRGRPRTSGEQTE